jgi:hypothetical protein
MAYVVLKAGRMLVLDQLLASVCDFAAKLRMEILG